MFNREKLSSVHKRRAVSIQRVQAREEYYRGIKVFSFFTNLFIFNFIFLFFSVSCEGGWVQVHFMFECNSIFGWKWNLIQEIWNEKKTVYWLWPFFGANNDWVKANSRIQSMKTYTLSLTHISFLSLPLSLSLNTMFLSLTVSPTNTHKHTQCFYLKMTHEYTHLQTDRLRMCTVRTRTLSHTLSLYHTHTHTRTYYSISVFISLSSLLALYLQQIYSISSFLTLWYVSISLKKFTYFSL